MIDLYEDETNGGYDCDFFNNGDGTGWKVYQNKYDARVALAAQMVCFDNGFGPDCFPEVVEIDRGTSYNQYGYLTELVDVAATAEEDFLKGSLLPLDFEVSKLMEDERVRLLKKVRVVFGTYEAICLHDLHQNNWGFNKNHVPVVIDTGRHFTMSVDEEWLLETAGV